MSARASLIVASGCGAGAAIAYARIVSHPLPLGTPGFFAAVAVAAAAYGVSLIAVMRVRPTLAVVLMLAALTLAMRVPMITAPVGRNSDMYRYLWDARVQRAGLSPYVVIPSDPRVRHLHSSATAQMNNMDAPSPYPPGAQLFFRGVTAIHESTYAIKVALLACDLAIAVMLVFWLRSMGRNPLFAIAYAWHPLVVIEVAHGGHLDILGACAVVVAVRAIARGWRTVSVAALVCGIAVKFLPIVIVPLWWGRVRLAHAAIGVALLAAVYAVFLDAGAMPVGAVANIVRAYRFNGPVFKALDALASPWVAAAAGVAAGLAVAIALRASRVRDDAAAVAWPMAAALVAAPLVYPWYLIWLAPFFISALAAPLTIWAVAILAVYTVWEGARAGGQWVVPLWVGFVEYALLAASTAWLLMRARRSAKEPSRAAATAEP